MEVKTYPPDQRQFTHDSPLCKDQSTYIHQPQILSPPVQRKVSTASARSGVLKLKGHKASPPLDSLPKEMGETEARRGVGFVFDRGGIAAPKWPALGRSPDRGTHRRLTRGRGQGRAGETHRAAQQHAASSGGRRSRAPPPPAGLRKRRPGGDSCQARVRRAAPPLPLRGPEAGPPSRRLPVL